LYSSLRSPRLSAVLMQQSLLSYNLLSSSSITHRESSL
jgi:hypothetical protein